MNTSAKYIFAIVLFIGTICLFAAASDSRPPHIADSEYIPSYEINLPPDTVPRFPVKKTQAKTVEELAKKQPIDFKDPSNITTRIDYDPSTRNYIFRTIIGDQEIATPISLTSDEYLDYTLKQSMADYFKSQNTLLPSAERDNKEFSLKDMKLDIGSGERLFGPGGIKFKANGYIETSMGMKFSNSETPTLSERNRKKSAFYFDEDIQVNIGATVGNKINFDMNYDTKAMFDFDSKKLKLAYDPSLPQFGGDQDGIIKAIEAGNVSMSTTNSLISGGTSLFGIRTELQFGKLRVNSIISQQEAQSRTVNSQGNIQTTQYEFKADQYDENRHFFINHYFRDHYDAATSKLPYVNSPIKITQMEVWITNKKQDFSQARNIVAFADMAEYEKIKNTSMWNTSGTEDLPYNGANDLYSKVTTTYAAARNINQVTSIFAGILEGGLDYEKVENARLLNTSEYTYNDQLGYISLNTTLQADEVLAVAYKYTMNGNTYQVGELSSDIANTNNSSDSKSGALFVRLLKPVSLSPRAYTWDLMMKNVYSLGASSIQQDRFRLNISYQADTLGTYVNYLPEGKLRNKILLQVMNLDRLDQRNNAHSDGIFDYLEGYTVRSENGRIYFPVVEPFGSHLAKMIDDPAIAKKYIYQELYDSTKTVAQQTAEKNKFKIYGSYRGSANSSDISLNATNVPQGSVKVTAAGTTLTEGVDYIVDYSSGNVTIINQSLIDTNTPIQVSLEDRTFSMQRKTMLGLNLSYDISKDFNIGATIMHLSEKPLTTKTIVGEESVKNTLWGFNASYKTQSQWLTNLVDKLPFVEATQPSQISFNGEFAQMIAGHYQNEQTGGYSYLDDFETSESRIDIKNPYAWSLAATPTDIKSSLLYSDPSKIVDYGKNRAHLAWFMIDGLFTRKNSSLTPQHIKNDKKQLSDHFVREILLSEIYPNKDVASSESATLPVLNLSYYPTERGIYNLDAINIDSDGKLLQPRKRWAGITRKMDVRDFEASNIEYLEFWMMDPFVNNDNPEYTPNTGGDLYINLGEISEDVMKDGKKFYENGLPIDDDPSLYDTTVWGRVPNRQSTVYAFDNSSNDARRKQDVGLNGLSTEDEFKFQTYADYLTAYRAKLSGDAIQQQEADKFSPLNDPSGDNYSYFRSSYFDQNQASILDRYKHYNGTEGNSASQDESGESYATASRTTPDVEDIDQDNTLNENEAYFEYKIKLDPAQMNIGNNYIVDSREVEVPLRDGTTGHVTWYQFKVPVRNYNKRINIQDFKSIRFMRMYMHNFAEPTFLRFATMQLVRGEWRTYTPTLNVNDTPSGLGTIDISTVNIEENSKRKPVSYVLPPGLSRSLDPDQTQLLQENEQSLSMRITDLDAGDARAIYKNTAYDLRRYKRLQLFTHLEELIENGTALSTGDLTVFMRLGTDYKNNYYEYEIPLSVTPAGSYSSSSTSDRYMVWPTNNMFDFPLELLKNIKLNRNKEKRKSGSAVSFTTLYSEYDPEKLSNKVSVKGNPSLSDINVIMIGVRNNSTKTKSGEVWVNELRLTDFDEDGGWAAQGNLNIALSDLGTINISGRKETVGFGALDQSLLERRMDDYQLYNIAANIDLGRFVPEKAKVSIPLYYAYSNQTNTPKYDPFDQDVTLNESLDIAQTKAERDSIKNLAQTKVTTKSLSLTNVKVDIKSKTPMPYDPANFNFGYSSSITESSDPSTVYDVIKDYKLGMNYSYSPIMKTWQPFKKKNNQSQNNRNNGKVKKPNRFAESIGFNYLPSNIAFNSNISRYYSETLIRDIENYSLGGANNSQFLTHSQSFYWDRDFNINWDFTKNLKFSLQTGTRAEIEEGFLQVNKKLNRDEYDRWKDTVRHSIMRLGTPLSYRQTSKITYQFPFNTIPAMDWVNSNLSYSSGYNWDRGAKVEGVEIGNTVENNFTLTLNNRLNMLNLYNKSGFLKSVNEKFDNRRRQGNNDRNRDRGNARENREATPKKRNFRQDVTLLKDSNITVTHSLATKDIAVVAKRADGRTYALKFKKIDENSIRITNKDTAQIKLSIVANLKDPDSQSIWHDIAEYGARGMMTLRSIDILYSTQNKTNIAGFRPSVGDAFGQKSSDYGLSPGLGFAFGLEGGEDFIEKSLSRDWLVIDDINVTPAIYNESRKLEVKAQLEPFKGMKIELIGKHEKNERTEYQYMYDGMPRTYGGSFTMTTVALSSALRSSKAENNYYSAAFEKFLQYRSVIKNRLEQKYSNTRYPSGGFMSKDNIGIIGDLYNTSYGEVNPNSGDVLIPAFLAAYTGKDVNTVSLSAFPSILSMLPNWNLSYDGLSNVSFIKERFKSIRLNHAYTCYYQVNSFNSHSDWLQAGNGDMDDLGYIRDVLSGKPTPSSPYSFSSVSIAEMFNPLFGIEGTLNSNLTINLQYNNTRTLNLSMAAAQIVESSQKDFIVGASHRINEFNRIIGLTSRSRKNFNNDLKIEVNLSFKTDQALIRRIEEQYTQATSGITTVTMKVAADYSLSRALTLRAFFDRIMNKPLITSSSYPTTNSNFGISIRFTLLQ